MEYQADLQFLVDDEGEENALYAFFGDENDAYDLISGLFYFCLDLMTLVFPC